MTEQRPRAVPLALFSIPETKHNGFSDAPHPNREMETSEC